MSSYKPPPPHYLCPNSMLMRSALSIPIHQHINITLTRLAYPSPSSPDIIPIARATFPLSPKLLTPAKTLHDGIITLTLDTVSYLAVIPTLKHGENAVTTNSSFQGIGSVMSDGDADREIGRGDGSMSVVELEGKVLRTGGKLVFCESTARWNGRLVAKGMVTKRIVRDQKESKM